jgi:Ca-activated chloride channel homolog
MFEFAWPWMGLLILLPLLVRLLAPALRDGGRLSALRFPHLENIRLAFKTGVAAERNTGMLFAALLWLAWAGLVGAMMQPQIVDQMAEVTSEGYDIMLCVDLSGSMAALDLSNGDNANRLDAAKKAVGSFVKDRKDDRIGLVLFGAQAYMYAPLTQDTDSVAKMLDTAAVKMAGDSTAIGDALGLAVKALRDRPEKSRIIVLLTDGGDNASTLPPLQAAQLAKEYGIKVYTIGIGSDGPVPFPDENGNIVEAQFPIDENLLKSIADKTDGGFYRATDAEALQNVYADIDKLEKSTVDKRKYLIRTPLYRYPLGAALALLALLSLLPLLPARRPRVA